MSDMVYYIQKSAYKARLLERNLSHTRKSSQVKGWAGCQEGAGVTRSRQGANKITKEPTHVGIPSQPHCTAPGSQILWYFAYVLFNLILTSCSSSSLCFNFVLVFYGNAMPQSIHVFMRPPWGYGGRLPNILLHVCIPRSSGKRHPQIIVHRNAAVL